jgi:hypothetical protein
MKTYFGNYLGIVIDNNDPEYRGRVQVFIPHIMPTLFEEWNKKGENITINCVGDNMPQGLTSEIVDKLKKILPWAEAASPIVGQSAPGGVLSALAGALKEIGGATAGAISNVGQAAAGAISSASSSSAAPSSTTPSSGPQNLDQTPTSIPAGSLPPGTSCKIPPTNGKSVDLKNLKIPFIQRLNGFYEEAVKLGYKISCASGFRSYEEQVSIYARVGSPGAARPGRSFHEKGIAVDLHVTGPGVSIENISVKASQSGKNYDTPAFRDLLAKYGLHQPLHPINRPSGPEHWHVEPIETPAAGKSTRFGVRGTAARDAVAAFMSTSSSNSASETVSSSQFPAATSPLSTKDPLNTDLSTPIAPTTGV